MNEESSQPISFGRRIALLAAAHPERTAVVFVSSAGEERRLSWAELEGGANRMARLLAERGVSERDFVVIGLPNCAEHLMVAIGVWKLGACVLPLNAAMPARERNQILEVARPAVVVADWEKVSTALVRVDELKASERFSAEPLPDRIPQPGKAVASGGSTGRPKVIVDPNPWVRSPSGGALTVGRLIGMRPGQVQLVAGPLYHNAPFTWSHLGLLEDHTLIVMERFEAARAVELIERHRVNFGFLVPTMMKRIIQLPQIYQRDFSSVEAFFHSAAPCPAWLKQAWIDLIGGERLYEAFGSTEAVGFTIIRGDEWLAHRGSVGRPYETDVRILDENERELPPGEVGEIFMRFRKASGPTYAYLGFPPAKTTAEGFVSVGDLGWVDQSGYLFLADRRVDLVISGGANIYPAEVEAALSEHPAVGDVAVIGLPDEDWGKRLHAIIMPVDPRTPPSLEELEAHCRQRLTAYKIPKSYEFVAALPRDEAGKIRRSMLAAERSALAPAGEHGLAPQ